MLSDLRERFGAMRGEIVAPNFPSARIHAGIQQSAPRERRRIKAAAVVALALSLVAVATAAELAHQTHLRFTRAGGIVIKSEGTNVGRPVHSNLEIANAASRLNFKAILPAGLPAGTRPIVLYIWEPDMLAITYRLPDRKDAAHHGLTVFLVNPNAFSNQPRTTWDRTRATPKHMLRAIWRSGAEEVIVVSDGLTADELATMKAAMGALPLK